MCGVAGILGDAWSPDAQLECLERMLAIIDHRGPDGWGTFLGAGVALGHTRLSIVDPDAGHQPMASERSALVFNGEIFNHVELRRELEEEGARFCTHSDTEVLLEVLDRDGPRGIPRLNGQFSFLYWNRRSRTLLAVRDRYGMLPLYEFSHGGMRFYASEVRAFEAVPTFSRRFRPDALLEHGLLWNTLGDRTVYDGVRSLQTGCYELGRPGKAPVRTRYYSLGESQPSSGLSQEQAREELHSLLHRAVRIRLRSDVPVGCYLSGGLDSSVIAHLVHHSRPGGARTFSVSFEDAAFDESAYQREMAGRVDADHTTLTISHRLVRENFAAAVRQGERPLFRTAPVPLYLLSSLVREHDCKVILSGEGADEILWGYDSYKELKLLQFWGRHPDSKLRPQLIKRLYPHLQHYASPAAYDALRLYYESFVRELPGTFLGLAPRISNNQVLRALLRPEHRKAYTNEQLRSSLQSLMPEAHVHWSPLQRTQFLEMATLLPGYLLSAQGDRMSLAHGVEARYPFLDHTLVERVFHYPDTFKMPGFSQKHLLKRAFASAVPASIIKRPKLPYMAPDLRAFFDERGPCELVHHHLSPTSVEHAGVFEPRAVARLLQKFARGVPDAVGYRDNMAFCFIMSTQILSEGGGGASALRPQSSRRTVDLRDTKRDEFHARHT